MAKIQSNLDYIDWTRDIVKQKKKEGCVVIKCATAYDLVMQCHTGMGQLKNTNAMAMKDVIAGNPKTKFSLFYCGYPWLRDVTALMHLCPNVYPDLCWMPIISPSATKRVLHELIEVVTADKVCWGSDTWTSEESYGAVLAMRYVLTEVLEEKIRENYLLLSDAKEIIDNLLFHNAINLYQLTQKL